MEYKSPEDSLNVDTYIKVVGYACLYKASEVYVGEIDLDDITLTLVREGKPRELLKWFEKNDYEVREMYKGIYYVEKDGSFPIQVIVSGRLSVENQKWLTLLSSNLKQSDAERIVIQTEKMEQQGEKVYADAVLRVAVEENPIVFHKVRGESEYMFDALKELMKDDFDEAARIAEEKGKEGLILGALKNNSSAEEIARVLGIPLEEVQAVEKKMLEVSN